MDPATVATQLLKRPGCAADWVVIKCGPDGASVFTRRGDQVYVGSPAVEVGDTVGCGDSAAAAVVLGYAKICAAREKLFQASSGKIAYLPNARLAAMMEETLALATATGAATATTKGAGRKQDLYLIALDRLPSCGTGRILTKLTSNCSPRRAGQRIITRLTIVARRGLGCEFLTATSS